MNTIEVLKTHNAWRRGDDTRTQDDLGFSVTELGIAIDDAVRAIQERDKLRAELEECIRAWALRTSELEKERGRVKRAMDVISDYRFMAVKISAHDLLDDILSALSAGQSTNNRRTQ